MLTLTLDTLLDALPEAALTRGEASLVTDALTLCLDSRAMITPHQTLFVALSGPHFDGHDFLEQVARQGARGALIARGRPAPAALEVVIEVEDTLEALQRLAVYWRARQRARVLAITGSNGKTIVKELLSAILSRGTTLHRSPGSFNSQVGVPLSLLGIAPEHELAIIEAGVSERGEMRRLEAMIGPDFGLLTNISLAHPLGLPTLEVTLEEKLALFAHLGPEGWLVVPAELAHEVGARLGVEAEGGGGGPALLTFALAAHGDAGPPPPPSGEREVDYLVISRSYDEVSGRWTFTCRLADGSLETFTLRAPGEQMVRNATAAIAAAHRLGTPIDEIRTGLATYEAAPMRLEVHTAPDGITLINDAYSADPVSARGALMALVQHAGAQRKVAILGEMLELGERARAEHEALGGFAAELGVDLLIALGSEQGSVQARALSEGAQAAGLDASRVRVCEGIEALERELPALLQQGDVVLFKASRAVGLERVARRLLESIGPTRMSVSLSALRANFHALAASLGRKTRIMAVVKSFGYGNDATRVSMALIREGVAALSVAYPDEAIPLRKIGVRLPILINNTLIEEVDKIVRHELTALVYSREVAGALSREAVRQGKLTRVHLEVDTGMHRAGLALEEVAEFSSFVSQLPGLDVEGAMMHFAAADDAHEDDFSREQIARFDRALAMMREAGLSLRVVHAANTAAAWRFPEARYDMVRVGLGLYGLDPSDDVARAHVHMESALRMTTRVIHLRELAAGESIGYGRSHVLARSALIATIAVGYNDGFPRAMSNGGQVLIGGERCEVVGRVCMDVSMVDVSALRGKVQVGDEVVLFGAQGASRVHVDELAARAGTISYEILCNVSPRVRRIFTSE